MNIQLKLGWIILLFPGFLLLGQIISSVNFSLAQRLGLQENPDETDPLLQRAERYTAYWDLLTLVWMPAAGVLMLINHPLWPMIALVGGAIYFDTAGREAAKILSFKHGGIKIGSPTQHRLFFVTYFVMAILGVTVVMYSFGKLFDEI